MDTKDWPSLAGQDALARRLYGDHDGPARIASWLAEQDARIDDPAFAKGFADHIDLSGVVEGDYAHRLVRTSKGVLLGGIRFFGRDVSRPFVEVMAHDYGEDADGTAALVDAVASEWSAFAPLHLRLCMTPEAWGAFSPGSPDAILDVTVHAARHDAMTPPDGRVTLEPFGEVEAATGMVARRYADLARTAPDLARNIGPADPQDLRGWHDTGNLLAIRDTGQGRIAGLLAVAPGGVAWLAGDEVQEEVIDTASAGRGLAASAQMARAHAAPGGATLMVGTIDRLNHASRRTAERAGRGAVLAYVFVPLG